MTIITSHTAPGQSEHVWAFDGAQWRELRPVTGVVTHSVRGVDITPNHPTDVIANRSWTTAQMTGSGIIDQVATVNRWIIDQTPIFRYLFIAPVSVASGLADWVAGAYGGGIPTDWATAAVSTDDGGEHTHTLCTCRATRVQARALGSSQRALSVIGQPTDVAWVQTINADQRFSGWRSESGAPMPRSETVYQEGQVYQFADPNVYDPSNPSPDQSDIRGQVITASQYLSLRGLHQIDPVEEETVNQPESSGGISFNFAAGLF